MTDDTRFASRADHDERAIQWLLDHARSIKSGQQDLIYHAIALARIGSAVKPRPISEAPKDGEIILLVENSGFQHLGQYCYDGYWRGHITDTPQTWNPIWFYDLSALPPPLEQQEPT